MKIHEHEHDIECDVSPETDSCRACGVYHGGPPCPECGERAFHGPDCSDPEVERG
jgi:hypothetical protein